MLDRRRFDRLFVTPVLPYKVGSYDIDEAALRKFLHHFMQSKFVDAGGAVIINPVAGEVHFLSREEKKRVVQIAAEECKGKVPLFAGAIDWTTRGTVESALDAKEAGADGIFLIPPSGPSDITIGWDSVKHPEIWIDMIREIDRAVNLPMIAHPTAPPLPGWNSQALSLEPTLRMCREVNNIVGWKMTYNFENYKIIAQGLRSLEHHVAILATSSRNLHEVLTTGLIDGTAVGSWNYALEPMVEHIGAWRSGECEKAERLWQPLKKLHGYVLESKVHHHLRYKISAWLRGFIPSPFMRPPMPRPNQDEVLNLRDLLKNAGLGIISNAEISEGLNRIPR